MQIIVHAFRGMCVNRCYGQLQYLVIDFQIDRQIGVDIQESQIQRQTARLDTKEIIGGKKNKTFKSQDWTFSSTLTFLVCGMKLNHRSVKMAYNEAKNNNQKRLSQNFDLTLLSWFYGRRFKDHQQLFLLKFFINSLRILI